MSVRFGVNYIPSQGWLYSWTDWSAAEVRKDLAAIANLGLDHVRVHCIWPVFQPNRSLASPAALAHLRELVDIAGDLGLDVYVCVLNGWMSGTYFRPFWQSDGMSIFTDQNAIDAELSLLGAVADALSDRPAFRGVDIGNEPNVMSAFAGNSVSREEGDAWLRTLLEHCEAVDPGGFHVAGVDHAPWMSDDSPFSREALADLGAASVVHSWVFFTGALARYGATGTGTQHLARYLVELARAFADDRSDRPVWLQEIGVSPEWIPEEDLPAFAGAIIDNAVRAKPWGITWWCSHDIDPALSDFDSLEYGLGLFDTERRLKPIGRAVQEAVERHREVETPSQVGERPRLILPDAVTPGLEFADRYFELVEKGSDPLIVREARA